MKPGLDAVVFGSCDDDDGGAWHHQTELERQQQLDRNLNMKSSELSNSRFLKQEDIDGDVSATIDRVVKENVAVPGKPETKKGVIYFAELAKPMVLNATNRKRLERAYGYETDDWLGRKVIVYVDPEVDFGGEVTGGLRLRVPKTSKEQAALTDLEDDIPV